MSLTIQVLKADDISVYSDLLKQFRTETFKQYPYLMQTSDEHESYYLSQFIADKNAVMVVAFKDNKPVGISTGIPLQSDSGLMGEYKQILKNIFAAQDFNADEFYYCGEILHATKSENKIEVMEKLLAALEQQAKAKGFKYLCFIKMTEQENHPLKPHNYQDPEPIWKCGFEETNVKLNYSWPTIQADRSVKDQEHELIFWIKKIS